VADASAGKPTPCPLCGNIFTPPALAGSALDLPPAPPPPPPAPAYQPPPPSPAASKPVAAATAPPAAPPSPARQSTGLQPWCRCVLRREVVEWLVPGGLALAFLLTFFTWVACAPAGFTIFTQSAWGAAFGSFSESIIGNEFVEKRGALLTKFSGWNFLMLIYLLALFLATALAFGDKFVPKTAVLPDIVRPVWDKRRTVVNVACLVLFVLLLILGVAGFGLERAARGATDETVAPIVVADGSAPTAKQVQIRDLNYALEFNSYGLRRSWWFRLAVLAQLTAAIGVGLLYWLDRRGLKAEPWADFYC
jgi:hypothetical protein